MRESYDVIVIGAGASGLMCAIEAGRRGRRTLLVEHSEKPGCKILISGGGRCNFTNLLARPDAYLSENPHFARSALARYTPSDFIALVEKHGIAYHEKKLGQLFCDESSQKILEMLLTEVARAGVEPRTSCRVESVERNDCFRLNFVGGGHAEASALVVASGGLSIPKMGATDFGHRLARRFGLALVEPRPGLVPLLFGEDDAARFGALAGISIDAICRREKASFRENILFTHRGLSGPAILQVSSFWRPEEPVVIDLLPDRDARKILAGADAGGQKLITFLAKHLPRRFVEVWLSPSERDLPVARLRRERIDDLAGRLHGWTIHPAGTAGYAKAEVTVGGVDTAGLSSRTMEARHVPGLFIIGEAVDVTGWLGGYNFQWAWSSGWVAGQFV